MAPIKKNTFSCARCDEFLVRIRELENRRAVLCGIEAHVCVYQTAVDLLNMGFEVEVVADAVSSRTESNRKIGLKRVSQEGGRLSSVEMLLFELQEVAEGEVFRELAKLIR
jgi:nicotinamidase-related amidase